MRYLQSYFESLSDKKNFNHYFKMKSNICIVFGLFAIALVNGASLVEKGKL